MNPEVFWVSEMGFQIKIRGWVFQSNPDKSTTPHYHTITHNAINDTTAKCSTDIFIAPLWTLHACVVSVWVSECTRAPTTAATTAGCVCVVSVSLCVCGCLSVSVSMCVWVSVRMCLSVYGCQCVYLWSEGAMSVWVSNKVCTCVLCLCVCGRVCCVCLCCVCCVCMCVQYARVKSAREHVLGRRCVKQSVVGALLMWDSPSCLVHAILLPVCVRECEYVCACARMHLSLFKFKSKIRK